MKNKTDGFSCYVHIPYCIQKCAYCDFAVFTPDKLPPPSKYMDWLKQEVAHRHHGLPSHHLNTLYFGGGTPSLIPTVEIAQFIKYLKQYFVFAKDIEISLEINPGTITKLSDFQDRSTDRISTRTS